MQTQTSTVLAEWVEPHLPTVFSRWHQSLASAFAPVSAATIAAAGIESGMTVLDIGSGSGIPALTIAERVGPTGEVIATDPSPVFIAALEANARAVGTTHLRTEQLGVDDLGCFERRFDAATCQFGAMFFLELDGGLRQIRQALRSGGRAAFAAWGPAPENALFTSFWGAAQPYLPPAPPAPPPTADTPAPMRFAGSGSLSAALWGAGFAEVEEDLLHFDLVWPEPAERLLAFWLDLSGVETRIPTDRQAAFRGDALASIRRYAEGETVRLPAAVVLAAGQA